MLSNENFKYSDKEIIENEEGHGEDYLKVQDEIYKDMSLDEIFKQASDSWNNANPK